MTAQRLTIDDLFERLGTRGTGAYGLSDVTQLEHALQAASLARNEGLSDRMVVAALFHDVGHLFEEADTDLAAQGIDDKHEESSADLLAPLFGPDVAEPVRLHVASKRYLCSTESDYYDRLSEDSRLSLTLQGGLLSADEIAAFERNPYYRDGVALRRIDDRAKVAGLPVPDLDSYRETADAVLADRG